MIRLAVSRDALNVRRKVIAEGKIAMGEGMGLWTVSGRRSGFSAVALRILMAPLVAAAVALASCASSGGDPTVVKQTDTLSVPDTTSLLNVADMRIGPLDKIKVNVFGVTELSGDYQVDHLGQIRMPLVGQVEVKGYTPSDLAEMLEEKFSERYLNNAEINVQVLEVAGNQVTVEGTVEKPGMVPVRGRLSLMQAVALSGGLGDGANPKRVLVFRTIEGQRRVAVYDLTAIRRGRADDPQVFGNDIIVVDGSATSSSYRELLRSIPLLALFVGL